MSIEKIEPIKKRGAPKKHPLLVKKGMAFKFPQWFKDWLRSQPEAQVDILFNAVCEKYKLKPPATDSKAKKSN